MSDPALNLPYDAVRDTIKISFELDLFWLKLYLLQHVLQSTATHHISLTVGDFSGGNM